MKRRGESARPEGERTRAAVVSKEPEASEPEKGAAATPEPASSEPRSLYLMLRPSRRNRFIPPR